MHVVGVLICICVICCGWCVCALDICVCAHTCVVFCEHVGICVIIYVFYVCVICNMWCVCVFCMRMYVYVTLLGFGCLSILASYSFSIYRLSFQSSSGQLFLSD